jgi:hypothetical protein
MTTTLDHPAALVPTADLEPGTTLRRRATGLSLVGAGVVTMAGILTTPFEHGPTTTEYLDSLVGHPRQAVVAATLLHFGYLLFVPGTFVMARLARRAAPRLSAVAVVLATLGVGLSGLLVTDMYDLSIGLHSGTTGGAPTSDMTGVPLAPLGFITMGLLTSVGSTLGLVLVAFAMWRARLAPPWAPVAMLVGLGLSFGSSSEVRNITGFGLLCLGIVVIGIRVLRAGDARFAHGAEPR